MEWEYKDMDQKTDFPLIIYDLVVTKLNYTIFNFCIQSLLVTIIMTI